MKRLMGTWLAIACSGCSGAGDAVDPSSGASTAGAGASTTGAGGASSAGAGGASTAGAGGASTGGAASGSGGAAVPGESCHGFGSSTLGGEGSPDYHVTSLADSGPGTLRDAVSEGGRRVVFDVAGDIVLSDEVEVRGAFLTIDGFTAPAPGITLLGFGLRILGSDGAHDVIVRNIRIRQAGQDGIWIADGAENIVIDHVSIHGSFDGNIDITRAGTRDVSVCWSVLAEAAGEEKNLLFAFGSSRIGLHHNLLTGHQRNPQVTFDDTPARTEDTDTTLDMRNNMVWDWGAYGTRIRYGGHANVIANYYLAGGGDPAESLIVCSAATNSDSQCDNDPTNLARAFVSENVSGDGASLDPQGTEPAAFPATAVQHQPACEAAAAVLAGAGARPLDALDASYLSAITLAGCP